MVKRSIAVASAVMLVWGVSLAGASTTQLANGNMLTEIDATAGGAFATQHHDFTYYSFESKDVVDLTDAEALESTEWHIAFKRSEIRLNGGISGPGSVRGVDMLQDHDVVGEDSFDSFGASDLPSHDAFVSDGPAFAVNEWWSYDSSSHTISATGNAYEVRTADGLNAKFVVDGLDDPARSDAGRVTFSWVLSEGTDLSGAVRSATIDVSGGAEVYFDLDSGEVVTPSDPASSTDWDIHFSGYTIRLNGGISGPGDGGAFPAYQAGTSFGDISEAIGFGYFSDKAGSAFSTEAGEWYSYDSSTHILSTKNHVYVIDTGDAMIKMQMLNYYKEVAGSPVSGFVTFRWRTLEGALPTAVESLSWGQLKTSISASE